MFPVTSLTDRVLRGWLLALAWFLSRLRFHLAVSSTN